VKITKPFYLGTYEVTQAEYEKIMGENPSWFSPKGQGSTKVTGQKTDKYPVDSASWHDAEIFCRKLSEREGKTYRLPTEAEWEYACRAGTTGPFHFGNSDNGRLSNTAGDDPYGTDVKGPSLGRTTQVGSYAPNAFGLYDMHGNVFEWCADWFVPPVYSQRSGKLTINPLVSSKAPAVKTRVLRGGAWNKGKEIHARSALRRGNLPSWKGQNIGFRVVQEATQQARTASIAQSPKTDEKQIQVIKDPRAGELVFIPAGTFLMGAPENEKGAWPFEKPQHKVEIKTGFYIGKYEVTFEQFRVFAAETSYKTEAQNNPQGGGGYDAERKDVVNSHPRFSWRFAGFPQRSNEPVVNVTWNDAVAYCNWLTEKDGKHIYRLPTEAEHEYAGRAGTTTAYGWGQEQDSLIGNENVSDQSLAKKLNPKSFHFKRCGKGDDGFPFTAPVGSFKPNAFGVFDLHGNVSEWCENVYLEDRYQNPDKPLPKTGAKRVLRGGSYLYLHLDCRAARRVNAPADERRCDRGFRIVRELAPRPAAQALAEAKPHPVPATPTPTPTTPPVPIERDVISFQPLPTEEPVTSFTVTEDNRFLICSHQGANQVSIWDTLTKAKVAVLSTTSPRSVMSRGDQLFVANDGAGTISVFSRKNKWALTNQLDIEKPHIVYLSAPQDKFFKGEILVTCHGKGNQASYQDCHIYHLNVKDDRDKHISKSALATCSYDGRIVITQGSFHLSSAGGISAFAWDDFISSESPYPIYKGGLPQTS
ncbi:MAG: formylglycine-generating enzyme family protein, partial [Planctomycetaceae bacterium]|nr:formylglycine-generating enzyme family protein [Planctomycetaceae bacterium]